MKTLYLDCFAGISGDMLVGALLDLGLDPAVLEAELHKLPMDGYLLQFSRVDKLGIQAMRFKVLLSGPQGERLADSEVQEYDQPGKLLGTDPLHEVDEHLQADEHLHKDEHLHTGEHVHAKAYSPQTSANPEQAAQDDWQNALPHAHPAQAHGRTLLEIQALIESSSLSGQVKSRAVAIFTRLAEAEGKVHGLPKEQVHFHEVGGVDAMIDIVGACIGLEQLGIEQVLASPLHLGSGFVTIQHGLYPVPAPATAQLLLGVPAYTSQARGELVTPTGAAILTTIAGGFGPLPVMTVQAIGYGAGTRQREFPNVLRAYLGETGEPTSGSASQAAARPVRTPFPEQHLAAPGLAGYHEGQALVIEANIDDMNPQLFEHLSERLLEAGALDVLLIPVYMKKGRPGMLLHVLAYPPSMETLLAIIFSESTSIGVRTYQVTKRMLQRETRTVETPYGTVRIKVSYLGGQVVNLAPEYEDCRALARHTGRPLKEILDAARQAAVQGLSYE